ncbi:hypothetical protein SK128_009687 [Halocaridina rubra]|uniref:Ig-like domain-containing protein n=1 Tax=Halocaridina rubra TaxID=373956 RepID=A0AAN8WDT9_HALRR
MKFHSTGRPPPKLTWWSAHKEIRGHIQENSGEVINTLTVSSLQRHYLDQSFICHANSAELAVPVTAAVTVDLLLPPLSIKLLGVEGPLSVGIGVTAVCVVVGARPPPTVSWWLNGRPLQSTGERQRDEGNVTESQVVVIPTAEDQGRYLACRAETPGLLLSSFEDGIQLVVHYVPWVKISLNSRMRLHDIKEGSDVQFTCNVTSVPPSTSVSWFHNEVHVNPNTTGGVIVNNASLVLQHVNRYSSGAYTCRATNTEGQGISRPLVLDVRYSPVCKSGQRWVYGIAIQEMAEISCQVEAHPSQVSFQWVFNNSADTSLIAQNRFSNNFTHSVFILPALFWCLCAYNCRLRFLTVIISVP